MKVKLGRKKHGLTQEQLAEQEDKAVETISNIERGFAYTGLETLERISQILEIPLRDFFEDAGERLMSQSRLELESTLRGLFQSMTDRELRITLDLAKSLMENRS